MLRGFFVESGSSVPENSVDLDVRVGKVCCVVTVLVWVCWVLALLVVVSGIEVLEEKVSNWVDVETSVEVDVSVGDNVLVSENKTKQVSNFFLLSNTKKT